MIAMLQHKRWGCCHFEDQLRNEFSSNTSTFIKEGQQDEKIYTKFRNTKRHCCTNEKIRRQLPCLG
jgi:hypothetical protein